jgi:aminopeptidase
MSNNGNITTVTSLGGGFREKKGPGRRDAVRKSIGSTVKELKGLEGLRTSGLMQG